MNENGFNNTRATIKDVAVKANVSLSTVSRALREPDKTPAETVSKVRAAAEALNYVYNATAGSLSKALDTIGILLPSPTWRRSA
ncbi:MAG: LacI family DNA-binding transcriptional regulator [Bilophila wadsworthia]